MFLTLRIIAWGHILWFPSLDRILRFSLGQAQTIIWSSSVCQYACVILASDRSQAVSLSETSQVNTDSQRSVNCALPLVTLKPVLSVGQLPGYVHTVKPLSPSKPAQRSNKAPELSLYWKQTKCAIKMFVMTFCILNSMRWNTLNM